MIDYQAFWKNPTGKELDNKWLRSVCVPEFYIGLDKVTEMVTTTLLKYLPLDASICELGCGTGRNLAGLKAAGYFKLSGVEISASAIELGRKNFPLLKNIPIQCAAVEEVINDLSVADCIFTQGFLMHVPPASEWIFEVISRKARKLIMTSENEDHGYIVSWKRDYGKIFTAFGWKELEREKCGKWGQLPDTTIRHVLKKEIIEDENPGKELPEQSAVIDANPKRKRGRPRQ